jgi:hypothetical protein
MRHLRITFGLALTACTLAVAAAPALATPVFKASRVGAPFSESEPGTTKGVGLTVQEFNFGGMIVKCPKLSAKGKVTWEFSKTLATEVKFRECSTIAHEGAGKELLLITTFKTPVDFVFHANGFAEVGTEFEGEVEISGGEVEMKVSGVRGKCVIGWPAQTIPVKAVKHPEEEFSAAEYSVNPVPRPGSKLLFPSGFQNKLVIANEFKGIHWEVVEGCENFTVTKGSSAKYNGTLEEEVAKGNLEPSTE